MSTEYSGGNQFVSEIQHFWNRNCRITLRGIGASTRSISCYISIMSDIVTKKDVNNELRQSMADLTVVVHELAKNMIT